MMEPNRFCYYYFMSLFYVSVILIIFDKSVFSQNLSIDDGDNNNSTNSSITASSSNNSSEIIIICPLPPLVPNSRVSYPNRNVGAVANYSCFGAYRLIGITTPLRTNITCLPDGKWSDADFACALKKDLEGDEFELIPQPTVDFPASSKESSKDPGIPEDVSGIPISLVFSEEGAPHHLPVLSGLFCQTIPRIKHGTLIDEGTPSFSTALGSRLSFMCNRNYYLVGATYVECLHTLIWSEPPVCLPYCQSPPIVPDSVQRVGLNPKRSGGGRFFTANMTVEYVCNSGYVLVSRNGATLAETSGTDTSERVVTCLENGQWSDPPMCLRVEMEQDHDMTLYSPIGFETCGPPPPTRHGNVTLLQSSRFYAVGDTAKYTCFRGYRLVGPAVIECMQNLRWSMNPTCVSTHIIDTCPSPPVVPDSIHVKANPDTGWIAGETVLYLCQRGFYRAGDPVIQCMPKGYWTSPPRCIVQNNAEGLAPPYSSRMMIQPPSWHHVKSMNNLNGYHQKSAGSFMVSTTPFNKFDCAPPPNVEHGYIIQVTPTEGRYPRGTVVTYRCAPAYTLYGDASITCTDILLWEPPPQCRATYADQTTQFPSGRAAVPNGECPQVPPIPPNTMVIERYMPTGRATIGSFIVLDCLPNHYMVDGAGSPILWCDSNYRWQHQDPPLQCRPKPKFETTTAQPTKAPVWGAGSWFQNNRFTRYPSTAPQSWANYGGDNNYFTTTKLPTWVQTTLAGGQTGPLQFMTDANGDPFWPDMTPTTTPPITGTTEVPSCTPPPEISNGFMVKITRPNYQNAREMHRKNILYYYGVTVTYVCSTGYNFMGASTIMCQWSGEWSGIPLCVPLATQPTTTQVFYTTTPWYTNLPEITFYTHATPPFWYNTETTHSTTETTTIPFSTTEMLPRVTTPQIICDLPPTISDGIVISQSPTLGPMAPGSNVQYACMGDLMLYGRAVVYCMYDGKWQTPPSCIPRDSDTTTTTPSNETPPTTHPTEPATETAIGGSGKISTTPSGSGESSTGEAGGGDGGGGSETTTTTTAETTTQQHCGAPPAIPNGELIYVLPLEYASEKTYYIGTAATFGCSSGFRMIGTPTAYCGNDLTWHGVPVCSAEPTTTQLSRCPEPPSVRNGYTVANAAPADGVFNPGSSVQYQCNAGYRMIGFPRIFCTFELTWEGEPICEVETTTSPSTTPSTSTTQKTTTHTTTTTKTPATTVGLTVCGSPPLLSHGSLIAAPPPPYTMGTIARYSCETGYALMGPDSVVCLPFSIWSTPPECMPFTTAQVETTTQFVSQRDCSPPPTIPYGTSSVGGMSAPSYSPGSAVVYSCDSGYALIGTPIVICAVDGQWSTPPECDLQRSQPSARSNSGVPKRICPEPAAVLHGYRASQAITDATVGWQTGDTFDIDCFPPYIRLGRGKTVCSEDGTWSSIPTCVRPNNANTFAPAPVAHPQRAKSASASNSNNAGGGGGGPRYRYKVEPRQQQKGPPPVQPLAQPPIVGSAGKACTQPPGVEHAVAVLRSGTGQMPGTAYLYICEPPFRLRGSPTVICSTNGQWSTVPSCEPPPPGDIDELDGFDGDQNYETTTRTIYCGPPPTVENGKLMSVPATSVVGSIVTYECLPQFHMRGPYTISCLPSGRWSKTPDCVPFSAMGSSSLRNNRAFSPQNNRNDKDLAPALPPVPVRAHARTGPMLFSSRFDTPSSLLFSAYSSPCYGGPDWPGKLMPGQLSTKLSTRELHIFREITFNCTGLIVEWRYISVLPLKSEPVIVHFGIWRLVHPRGLKYRLVDSTRVTIVGSVKPEETVSLKLHEAEFLHIEPGDVFGLHYDNGATSQMPGAIPLAYTFSPSPFTQPQLSSTLASLDDHQSILRKQHQQNLMKNGGESLAASESSSSVRGNGEIIVDFDNYGFRFFRLPFVRAVVHMI